MTLIQNVFACISEASEDVGGELKQNMVLKIAWHSKGRSQWEMGKEGRKAWKGLDPNSSTVAKMTRKVSLKEACPHPGDRSPPPFLPLPSQRSLLPPFYIPRAASEQGRKEGHCAKRSFILQKGPWDAGGSLPPPWLQEPLPFPAVYRPLVPTWPTLI